MKDNVLIQVSVEILPEAEEAVFVLFGSLFGQTPSIYTDAETQITTAAAYLPPRQWRPSLKKAVREELNKIRACGLHLGTGKVAVRKIRRENWAESWKRHFKPIEIGKALLIKPSWSKRRAQKGQAVVVLDPGLSFGTGQHATTSFCLQQLVKYRKPGEQQSFLDIGTGSGILAIAAAKAGYGPVAAFDFDPEAVRVSRENARKNRVEQEVWPIRQDLTKLPRRSKRQFDLVCANLIYDLLLAEAERIVYRMKPSGSLILAGILTSQFNQVNRRYERLGLRLVATTVEREWQSGRFILP